MRFVAVKDEEQQANGVVFRVRHVPVRQRTQCINALREHLTEYGWVVPKGPANVATLIGQIEDPNCSLSASARAICKVLITTLASLDGNIAGLDAEISRGSKEDPVACRLMTIPRRTSCQRGHTRLAVRRTRTPSFYDVHDHRSGCGRNPNCIL